MKSNFINRTTSRIRNYFFSLKSLNYIPIRKAQKSYDIDIGSLDFATIVFENACDLLVDLVSDTTLILKSGNPTAFKAFSDFFYRDGKRTLVDIFVNGYAVIGYLNGRFEILDTRDYYKKTDGKKLEFVHRDTYWQGEIIVFEGEHHRIYQMSHFEKLKPFLEMLNNVLNASNTITKKLGVSIFATPRTISGMNTVQKLLPKEIEKLEKSTEENYGVLDTQKVIHFLSDDLRFEVINLAGQNLGLEEKLRIATLAIVDKIKVPANQVSLIDANTSKAFANGSEILEGDFQKYQSFERLLVSTFVELAKMLQIDITYEIYNKPKLGLEQ
ncbi:MAG TPA: hypothetical protein PLF32_09820 [Bacteroidales bacterium]|nr:hypothetical protein [Bacteroidales bacterium]